MKNQFKVVCRGSMLSQAQAELFKNKLLSIIPEAHVDVIIKDTEGDRNQDLVLQELEGKDFFTRDIQNFLVSGQADFAVHSLKDVSGQSFFQSNHFAIIEREDPRDVAIFNKDVVNKIAGVHPLRIGTSSPRRVLMSTGFLRQALPVVDGHVASIEAIPIRGNVDTRLRKLSEQQYDGIILAVAGLNRLLTYGPSKKDTDLLLRDKRIMVLPFFECPPAPGQGAIVAETTPENTPAVELLEKLNHPELVQATRKEREFASQYGSGCHQQFGVVHIDALHVSFTYGSGTHRDTTTFTDYRYEKKIDARGKTIFSAGDLMKDFFSYRLIETPALDIQVKSFFVASHKAIHSASLIRQLSSKSIWAAGSKTWFNLAKKGLWVEGCADALGLEFITPWLESPLIKISKHDLQILTDTQSAEHWREGGWNATATYELLHELKADLVESMSRADVIFWTSFRQFMIYQRFLKKNVKHCCGSGKTVEFFLKEGIQPFVFPGIKAFNEWRKISTTTVTEG